MNYTVMCYCNSNNFVWKSFNCKTITHHCCFRGLFVYRLAYFHQELHLTNGSFRNYLTLVTHCKLFPSHVEVHMAFAYMYTCNLYIVLEHWVYSTGSCSTVISHSKI